MSSHRIRLITGRWVSLTCCGIVAAAIILVAEPFLRRLCEPIVKQLSSLAPKQLAATLLVLSAAACWSVGRRRWQGFLGLRFFFTYPPLWVAVLVAGFSLLSARGQSQVDAPAASLTGDLVWLSKQIPTAVHLAFLLVVALLLLARSWRGINTFRRAWRCTVLPPQENGDQALKCFDDLCDWLRDDSKINTPASDRFGHDQIAKRIATRLAQKREAPTIAVIGPLGSGKSSICSLVAHHLRDSSKVRLINVSLWPFDSTEAAVRGIFEAILEELGRAVNVLSLAGLSEEYVGVVERAGGSYGGIAQFLRGPKDPERIVRQFSNIACAAGLRLVLWIEDMERFSSAGGIDGEIGDGCEVERLGPIRALLYLLDGCPEISVVISDTSLRTRFDIGKIARFVEHPPKVDSHLAWQPIDLLRTRCLGGHPVRIIDPTSHEVRKRFTPVNDPGRLKSWIADFSNNERELLEAVSRVLDTPRALKSALRVTLEIWETMPGEVDFDCVLVASALRVARPQLFALLSDHIDLFRFGLTNPFPSQADGEKGKPHSVVERIDQMRGREDPRTAAAVRILLHYLFPKYPPEESQGDKEYVARPQGMFVVDGADFWQRYIAQSPVDEADSDQRALTSIAAWREGRASDLVDRIIDAQRGGQVERFVGQFDPIDLCRLLENVAARLSDQSAAHWDNRAHAPGITSVWRMMLVKRPPEGTVHRTVSDIVRRFTPVHLPLAYEVVYFFAKDSPRIPSLMTTAQREDVEQVLHEAIAVGFSGDEADVRLARALKEGSPWLFRWIVYRLQEGLVFPLFEGWPEVACTLLRLAETRPAIGIPILVPLVTRSSMQDETRDGSGGTEIVGSWAGQFDATAARQLFDYSRLMRVFADFEIPDDCDDQLRSMCRAAIDAARADQSSG